MINTWDVIEQYRGNAVYVTVEGAIINSQTQQRAPFRFSCLVDTGCEFGLYYEETLRSDAESVGVVPTPTRIRLGDGTPVPAHVCIAHIERINKHILPPPGIPVQIFMRGSRRGFMGMEALKHFVTHFDGPSQELKIKF